MAESSKITVVKSKRRTIAMHMEPDGSVVVKVPSFMPQFLVKNFIVSHQDWIDRHRAKIKKVAVPPKADDEYYFLGKKLKFVSSGVAKIQVKGDQLLFPHPLIFRKDKELHEWYLRQAKEIITKQTDIFAERMKTKYKAITFSDTKSQWGRCTQDNRLQFNWRLVMAPPIVLNYVVVHELAHTMEKNHTQMFWMKVRGINPSYRQQIKWLKDYGATLKIK